MCSIWFDGFPLAIVVKMKPICIFLLVLVSTQAFPQEYESSDPKFHIIGGHEAPPHIFTYQVGIFLHSASGIGFCGGSLISSNYVLTAAHCADETLMMELVFGAQNITDKSEETQIRINSTEFIVHENYSSKTLANDIALVKLSEPIKENNVIKIIPIASGSNTYAGSTGVVSGWGVVDNEMAFSGILKFITRPILSNAECTKATSITLLCASGIGKVGACDGYSGGPLVVEGVQVGLVSLGSKACWVGLPTVFTRLTEYKSWVTRNSDATFVEE